MLLIPYLNFFKIKTYVNYSNLMSMTIGEIAHGVAQKSNASLADLSN